MPLPPRLLRLLPLAFALVMGLVAVVLINRYLGEQRQRLEAERKKVMAQYQEPIDVVVAANDLPEGTVLELSHLSKATVPERFVQPNAARAPGEVLGKITVAPMAEGEQILTNKLRRPDDMPVGSTLSSLTPPGKRASTIAVDTLTGVGGFVRPGDIVDILWTLLLPEPGRGKGQSVTLTLFQDVPVLAVGREMMGRRPSEAAAPGESAQYTVTLALTPQETSFLLFAREQGRVQLSLRPRSETGSQVVVVPANMNTLMEMQLGIKMAGPPPRAIHEVEVYKGLEQGIVAVPGEE